jgi:hypothetical protein
MNNFKHKIESRCRMRETWRKGEKLQRGGGATSCGQIPRKGDTKMPLREEEDFLPLQN